MDVVLAKTLDLLDQIMELFTIEDIKRGREDLIEGIINKLLTDKAKIDNYKMSYQVDLSNCTGNILIEFPDIQFTKKYELGSFM